MLDYGDVEPHPCPLCAGRLLGWTDRVGGGGGAGEEVCPTFLAACRCGRFGLRPDPNCDRGPNPSLCRASHAANPIFSSRPPFAHEGALALCSLVWADECCRCAVLSSLGVERAGAPCGAPTREGGLHGARRGRPILRTGRATLGGGLGTLAKGGDMPRQCRWYNVGDVWGHPSQPRSAA